MSCLSGEFTIDVPPPLLDVPPFFFANLKKNVILPPYYFFSWVDFFFSKIVILPPYDFCRIPLENFLFFIKKVPYIHKKVFFLFKNQSLNKIIAFFYKKNSKIVIDKKNFAYFIPSKIFFQKKRRKKSSRCPPPLTFSKISRRGGTSIVNSPDIIFPWIYGRKILPWVYFKHA